MTGRKIHKPIMADNNNNNDNAPIVQIQPNVPRRHQAARYKYRIIAFLRRPSKNHPNAPVPAQNPPMPLLPKPTGKMAPAFAGVHALPGSGYGWISEEFAMVQPLVPEQSRIIGNNAYIVLKYERWLLESFAIVGPVADATRTTFAEFNYHQPLLSETGRERRKCLEPKVDEEIFNLEREIIKCESKIKDPGLFKTSRSKYYLNHSVHHEMDYITYDYELIAYYKHSKQLFQLICVLFEKTISIRQTLQSYNTDFIASKDRYSQLADEKRKYKFRDEFLDALIKYQNHFHTWVEAKRILKEFLPKLRLQYYNFVNDPWVDV